jgi:hypothetical protein
MRLFSPDDDLHGFACHCCLQDSASSLQYAAFFADCEHELTPLTRGMRLVLTYNQASHCA